MRNVKTNENKSIDVGDGLVEDHSGNSRILKYGSEEKGSSLYKCSSLLGFILSKNLRGL